MFKLPVIGVSGFFLKLSGKSEKVEIKIVNELEPWMNFSYFLFDEVI